MAAIDFLFLDRPTVESLLPDTRTLLDIIAGGLAAHGRGDVVLPAKSHLHLDDRFNGHFNILPGYVVAADVAGIKVIGDYVENYRHGLPSEIALLTLYDPKTGAPTALIEATTLTWLRTGAVTGIGARHLARRDSRVVAHIGARGTAFSNLVALAELFDLTEIRIASKRPETSERLAEQVRARLGLSARAAPDIRIACDDADIVIEATRLERPEMLIRDDWLKPGSLLVTYGWVMAIDPRTAATVDKRVVDDWPQCQSGGALYPLIERGLLRQEHIHAEIGQIVCGERPGRTDPGERILFWHRGFAIGDIVLGHWIVTEARKKGVGRMLTLWRDREE